MDWTKRPETSFRRFRNALILLAGILLLTTATAPRCQGQTFAEWFRQKKTQKKYLVSQIAALRLYAGYVKKGYELVDDGLETVRKITDGEFSVHEAFITRLKKVNPLIQNDARVAEIIALQLEIVKNLASVQQGEGLRADQLLYLTEVSEGVIAACYQDLEELLLVITSGKLEMPDNERISRLNMINARTLDKSAFARDFTAETMMVIRSRAIEQSTLEKLRRYYEIE